MKTENKFLLDKIVKNKCAELGIESMEIQKEGPVVSILKEDWHLFIEFRNPLLPPLQLQCAITIEEDAAGKGNRKRYGGDCQKII